MTIRYAELHCHSCFSLLDGAALPEVLAARAAELGLAALALTDHDELGGVVRFSTAAREVGLTALIGAELTVAVPDPSGVPRLTHLPLLAESAEGYANLSTLVTRARGGERPRGQPHVTLAGGGHFLQEDVGPDLARVVAGFVEATRP